MNEMVSEAVKSTSDNGALLDMLSRREAVIDAVCEQLALGRTLSRICCSGDMPDRRTIYR